MTTTPKTLNVTECHQLLDALLCRAGTQKQFGKGLRNYTMGLLMLDAGLRVGEVVQLRPADLWYGLCAVLSLVVRKEIAKNKSERIVPLSSRIRAAIEDVNKTLWSGREENEHDYAFFQTDPNKPLTTRQVERIIRAAALKALGRPVHPHMLRHTFGTRLMRITNARIVQELLGHSHIATTQIYMHPNHDDLVKAIGEVEKGPAALIDEISPSPP